MSIEQIIAGLKSGAISEDDARGLLKPAVSGSGAAFRMKVSEKGCIQIRGIRGIHHTFGLSLYVEAMEDLFSHKAEIESFIESHKDTLSRKDRGEKVAA